MTIFSKSIQLCLVYIFILAMYGCDKASQSTDTNKTANTFNAAAKSVESKPDLGDFPYKSGSFEAFKLRRGLKSNQFEDYKTKYKDGRKSEIRTMFSYESMFYDDNLQQAPKDKLKIATVIVEWSKLKGAVIADEGAFSNNDDNSMFGGSVESNKLISPKSSQFMQLATLYFINNKSKLTEIKDIPNRNVDEVSVDFVTNQGVFTIQDRLKNIESGNSSLSQLFVEAKKVNVAIEMGYDIYREK